MMMVMMMMMMMMMMMVMMMMITLYCTRTKIKATVRIFTNVSVMTNATTLNTLQNKIQIMVVETLWHLDKETLW